MAPVFPPATASGLMMPSVRVAATTPPSGLAQGAQPLFQKSDHVNRPAHDVDPRQLKGGQLLLRGSGRSRDNGPRMSHSPALGRGLACDEADDGLGDSLLHERRSLLFVRPADLTDHDDSVGGRIALKSRARIAQ